MSNLKPDVIQSCQLWMKYTDVATVIAPISISPDEFFM